jgi:hypothetical protein
MQLTPSSCFSSPFVKFSTVPFVSVCEISSPHVYTATFAFVAFFTMPAGQLAAHAELHTHPRVHVRKPSL